MDEATANIDLVTEEKIQKLINLQFKDFTVITIAHRLQTIINSDRILVLGDGKNMEYGSPQELLKDNESEFTKLVNELKHSEWLNKNIIKCNDKFKLF